MYKWKLGIRQEGVAGFNRCENIFGLFGSQGIPRLKTNSFAVIFAHKLYF